MDDLFAGNPYLEPPNKWAVIGSMQANIGAGIGQANAQGAPWYAGIGPGAAMATQALAQDQESRQRRALEAQQFQQMGAYRKAQIKHLESEGAANQFQMDLAKDLMARMGKGGPVGFNMQPPAIQTYDEWKKENPYGPPPRPGATGSAVGQAPPEFAEPARPKTKAEFDALPKGATFIDPMGNRRVKP